MPINPIFFIHIISMYVCTFIPKEKFHGKFITNMPTLKRKLPTLLQVKRSYVAASAMSATPCHAPFIIARFRTNQANYELQSIHKPACCPETRGPNDDYKGSKCHRPPSPAAPFSLSAQRRATHWPGAGRQRRRRYIGSLFYHREALQRRRGSLLCR